MDYLKSWKWMSVGSPPEILDVMTGGDLLCAFWELNINSLSDACFACPVSAYSYLLFNIIRKYFFITICFITNKSGILYSESLTY